jgi:hypothetical protein
MLEQGAHSGVVPLVRPLRPQRLSAPTPHTHRPYSVAPYAVIHPTHLGCPWCWSLSLDAGGGCAPRHNVPYPSCPQALSAPAPHTLRPYSVAPGAVIHPSHLGCPWCWGLSLLLEQGAHHSIISLVHRAYKRCPPPPPTHSDPTLLPPSAVIHPSHLDCPWSWGLSLLLEQGAHHGVVSLDAAPNKRCPPLPPIHSDPTL